LVCIVLPFLALWLDDAVGVRNVTARVVMQT